jgi:DNA-directed RNA polymerase subunit alpha
MAVKYGTFEMPSKIVIDEESATPYFARFVAEPFEKGFGHTMGNSLRRMMLSSLEAPAIIAIRIEGVPHEYMAVEGIVEDMTNIILNVKGALLRRFVTDETPSLRDERILTTMLDIGQDDLDRCSGNYSVTLKDIVQDGRFEVVNPDLHLFTVTKPMARQVDLRIATGRGYVPSERHNTGDSTVGEIFIDACFSPVRLVNYVVENTRVGQDTDFDRLMIEITTDGRLSPTEALGFAAQIGSKHFEVFNKLQTHVLFFDQGGQDSDANHDEMMDKLSLRIDEIELSVRSTNCLREANIETIAELVSTPERRMLEFRNFGKKSLNEIKNKLADMGLYLGMDLGKYGIYNNDSGSNARQKVVDYLEERKNRRDLSGETSIIE